MQRVLLAAAAALAVALALAFGAGAADATADSSWIMANTRMPVPTCPAHCLTADGEDNVGFSACKSVASNASAAQEWLYEAGSGAMKQQRSGRCLGYTLSRVLKVVACEPNQQPQQWTVDVAAAAIWVRSESTTMYLAMASSSGSLWREAMLVEPGKGRGNRIVSLVPFGSPFSSSSSMVAARSSSAGNLLVNGGFQLSSYGDAAGAASVELAAGDTFGSCGWEVVHGQAQLVSSSSGRYDPDDRQLSMHLLADTTLAQRFQATSAGYYVLSFLLRAPLTVACDGQLRVRVAPSSMVEEITVKPLRSEYWTTKAYAFQAAAAAAINLSFHSWLCEVLIDDVRVLPLTVDLRVLPLTAATSTPPSVKRLSSAAMAAVIAGASVAAFLAGCLCAAVTIFRLLRPVPASETSECVSSVSQQQLQDLKRVPTFAGVRILSFGQIDKATHSFSTVLGKESLGDVYLAEFEDGTRGATKRIFKMYQLIEMDFFDTVKRLGRIVHPNIVKLIAFSRDHGEQILVFEYVPGVNLYQRLHASQQPCLPWNTRIAVALDVAVGLEFLHHVASLVHGRVKSSNVFVTKEGKAKLGHCALVSHRPRAQADGYTDPAGDSADKGDVYSFGVLLLELVSGRPPPVGGQQRELEVDRRLLALVEGRHQLKGLDQVVRMASACVQDEPEERPSMSEVVELLRQCAVLDSQAETTPETRSRPNSPA